MPNSHLDRVCCGIALFSAIWAFPASAGEEAYDRHPVNYSKAASKDATTAVIAKLANGTLRLEGDEKQVVRSLLKAFKIPEESQLLVFSKTSLQRERISPATPRALYFTDDVYIGWCPGGLLEVAAIDATLGPVFYKFDPSPARKDWRFSRDADCLRCHGGTFVRDIPGLLARSVYTDAAGEPIAALGSELVDASTPFGQRYGGWYVTGMHGTNFHRGNVFFTEREKSIPSQLAKGANLRSLKNLFDSSAYLRDTSDLTALLVFEHQLTVQNALTRANQRCLALLDFQQGVQRELHHPASTEPELESVEKGFADAVEQVLDALLSKGEAPLPKGGVSGIGGFASAFAGVGEAKSEPGPSLKDLDLRDRLFKYRCSYLIQTPAFEGLQPTLRKRVLRRLLRVLVEPADARYAYLEGQEREMIRRIIARTVRDLPPGWVSAR